MSLKFAGIPSTQKPPAICKKAPPPDAVPPGPFDEKIFQGWAHWYDPFGTDRVTISESCDLIPIAPPNNWEGFTAGYPYSLHIEMYRHAQTEYFTYSIKLLLHGAPVGTYQRNNVPAQTIDPFDSGLIQFITPPSPIRIFARIMS